MHAPGCSTELDFKKHFLVRGQSICYSYLRQWLGSVARGGMPSNYPGILNLRVARALLLASCSMALLSAAVTSAKSTTINLGTDFSSNYKIAEPVYTPKPEISPELQEQCFKSCCIAKFLIKKDGQTSVELLSSSGSQEVDDMALLTLRSWKFKPAQIDEAPVDSTRKIKVEFEVE